MTEGDHSEGIGYVDFEVEVVGHDGDYSVAVLRSEGGEARSSFQPPWPPEQMRNLWKDVQLAIYRSHGGVRSVLSPEEDRVRDLGGKLMESLLAGGVRTCWEMTRMRAKEQQKRIRLKLRLQSPELAALPWELLYEQQRGDYVALMRDVSIVRYTEQIEGTAVMAVPAPLRVLGLTAAPSDLQGLDVERERQRVNSALEDLQAEGLVDLVWLEGQTWRDLQEAITEGPWHVLHFIGHGYFDPVRDEGVIALVGPTGRRDNVHATYLARLLAGHPSLRLVVLNSCEGGRGSELDLFSSCAATLVRRGISAVLAMQYEIADDAAIEFSRSFYTCIGQSMAVEAATSEARIAMSLSERGSLDWAAPVLYLRTQSGELFRLPSREQQRAAVQARRLAEELERRDREEQARQEREEQERREREEQERLEREEQARREREEQERREREEQARRVRDEHARRVRDEHARRVRDEHARRMREEQARREREEQARREHEEQARREMDAQRWRIRPAGKALLRPIVLPGIVAAAVVGLVGSFFVLTAPVPTSDGEPEASALGQVRAAGLQPAVTTVANCSVAAGDVIRSEPTAGSRVIRGSQVRLVVSSSRSVSLPNVRDLSEVAAASRLTALGVAQDVTWEDSTSGRAGYVLRMTPASGTRVCVGSKAHLVAARGRPVDVVTEYYNAINARDYGTAYGYLSTSQQSRRSIQDFQNGFADTKKDEILDLSDLSAVSDPSHQVFILFTAHRTDGTDRTFAITYQVSMQDSHWVLSDWVVR